MTPSKLLKWERAAQIGQTAIYWMGDPHAANQVPAVFHTARKLHEEGKVLLYQSHGQWCARKLSTRAKRFVDNIGALTPTPPMGPYGLYAAGRGPDPDRI